LLIKPLAATLEGGETKRRNLITKKRREGERETLVSERPNLEFLHYRDKGSGLRRLVIQKLYTPAILMDVTSVYEN
jgi:hypothetical protein